MTTIETSIGSVHCTQLADGKLVQLGGHLGDEELPDLRLALLMPVVAACRDIVIDAGEVESIADTAVAVLMAAREWADDQGVRLLLSRSSLAFDLTLQELDVADVLPRLAALGPASARRTLVPAQRGSTD